ncbi:MAG: T9SS type A sorting domain-containing protein [Bacteroidetes bacterium]|nr:T9SS type A sorting domain-containing protein [Bacteroidota bacterium]
MKKLLFFLGSLAFTAALQAQIIHVPADFPTIQQAIDTANAGDTVLVSPGTYVENIDFKGNFLNFKNITVASLFLTTLDTSYISATIIDGNQSGSVITLGGFVDSSMVISGFTITNGNSSKGGGICIGKPTIVGLMAGAPSLQNLKIINNSAGSGGGVYVFGSGRPSFYNVTVSGNTAETGGGLCCDSDNHAGGYSSAFKLMNVTITDNVASQQGGGIHLFSLSTWINELQNVQIINNTGANGGGIYLYSGTSVLTNVTISDNSGSGIQMWGSEVLLTNSIVWNDEPNEILFENNSWNSILTVINSDIQGGQNGIFTNNNGSVNWLEGNINVDPLFAGSSDHTYALSDGSPCIDTGTPDTAGLNLPFGDIIGNKRIWDGNGDGIAIVDMGAYEFGAIPAEIDKPAVGSWQLAVGSYPNPIIESTTFRYTLKESMQVNIQVFDGFGQMVAEPLNAYQSKGEQQFEWNSGNLPAGIYYYRIQAGKQVGSGKIIKL